MSFFFVTIETIDSITPIEGADKIEKATLKGLNFTFVIPKSVYNVNDKILYFPIDSLIPSDVAQKIGVYGKLAGRTKDRVKTIRLKNTISQGIVGPISLIESLPNPTPETITEFLNVKKYEPPAILEKGANLRALPCGLSVYDIEGCERHKEIVDLLMDQECVISEKVEGSNFSISFDGEKHWVNQRRHTIELVDGFEHTWWKMASEQNLTVLSKLLYAKYGEVATIYGEMTGPSIQGNIYKQISHKIFVFDIKIGDKFMDASDYMEFIKTHNVNVAPILYVGKLREFMGDKTIVQVSNGNSIIYPGTLREGIVIKPIKERNVDGFGRLIIKQRDPIYLAGNEN